MKIFILALCLIIVSQVCVSRSDALAKAMEWVRDKVLYSQTAYHEGYRTDCSGFASCAWRLAKHGLTTRDFVGAKICAQTLKDRL